MPTARHGLKLIPFQGELWAIGGHDGTSTKTVELYDIENDSWKTGPPLTIERNWPCAWVANSKIYVAGGRDSNDNNLDTIEATTH